MVFTDIYRLSTRDDGKIPVTICVALDPKESADGNAIAFAVDSLISGVKDTELAEITETLKKLDPADRAKVIADAEKAALADVLEAASARIA